VLALEELLPPAGLHGSVVATLGQPAANEASGVAFPIFAGGRVLVVRADPGPAFEGGHPMRPAWLVGTAGCAVTAAVGLTLLQAARRRETLEALVAARTASLTANEARLRTVTDAARDAIVMLDPRGNVSFWNPAAEGLFGYTHAEVLGKNLHTLLVPARYYAAHSVGWPRFQQTGQGTAVGQTLELEARHRDGREVPVELSLAAVAIGGGWHAVGVLRDITARKRAEAELRAVNAQLEAATARANAMVVQAELAAVAKSEFLANMSHEIRTPMNGVIGMTSLLLETELTPEQRRYAALIGSSGEALLALINSILDFSKLEANQLDLEVLDFDLGSLLDDLAGSLAVRAQQKGIELVCAADPAVPLRLRGDPGRLRQVLTNLLGNAIKFTSQVDATTTRRYGGTGLGLAIAKQLVERMGGEIGATSRPGHGSAFWFTVCLVPQAAGAPTATQPANLAGVRALIVDDSVTGRETLAACLEAWGMRALAAGSGADALTVTGTVQRGHGRQSTEARRR